MINYDLTKITTIIFDVDGVLSSSTIPMNEKGEPVRTINIKDGYAIQLAIKMGLRVLIITGGNDESIRLRYSKLGVKDIFMGCAMKITTYNDYCKENNISNEETLYVGDDIPDYEIMKVVGCPCCPKDACSDIKNISCYISPYTGGNGCARDIIEQVLRTKGLWLSTAKAFGW